MSIDFFFFLRVSPFLSYLPFPFSATCCRCATFWPFLRIKKLVNSFHKVQSMFQCESIYAESRFSNANSMIRISIRFLDFTIIRLLQVARVSRFKRPILALEYALLCYVRAFKFSSGYSLILSSEWYHGYDVNQTLRASYRKLSPPPRGASSPHPFCELVVLSLWTFRHGTPLFTSLASHCRHAFPRRFEVHFQIENDERIRR